jgi:tetratricopeptide (TPR) repeat protein
MAWANGIEDAASATIAWDEVADQAQIIAGAIGDPDVWHLTGICCKSARRWDDAEEAFARALETRPDDPEDLYLSASVMRCLDRDQEAESRFNEALEHAPDPGLARRIHANLAALAEKRLALDEAVIHHRAANQLKRATEIEALAASFRDALASRQEIDRQLAQLETMARQLTELGENEGADGIRRQIDRIIVDRNALDANLSEVRKALKADDTGCG